MNPLRTAAKALLPSSARKRLGAARREYVFRRAIRRFLREPEACTEEGSRVLTDLVYGWGNEGWSAKNEYLAGCVRQALTADGPTLECGSGLSTILIGAVAKQRGHAHWALEHTAEWATRVRGCLDRYGLDSVVLCTTSLKDYGEFVWYEPPLESMPDHFSLVICDGPPAETKGGRYGLSPVMSDRLRPGCVILLDDASREQERAVGRRWASEFGASLEIVGSAKPYVRLRVTGLPWQPNS